MLVLTIDIVADLGSVRQTECGALLLTDTDAIGSFDLAIARIEFARERERFDGHAELLGGDQRQILLVIGILCACFGTRRRFGDRSHAAPSIAFGVLAGGIAQIQHSVVNTRFVEMFTNLVPFKLSHMNSFQ